MRLRPGSIHSRLARFRTPILVTLVMVSGCSLFGPDTEHFVVRVDSISAPAAIAPAETLSARFWGLIGPNGCSYLERVDQARGPDLLEVEFHGERKNERRVDCTQMLVLLEHDETVAPPLQDPFTIRVKQPDGTTLEKVVRVQ